MTDETDKKLLQMMGMAIPFILFGGNRWREMIKTALQQSRSSL